MATSGEFCLAADGAPTDCESVQFISGVELQDAQTLLLAYGPSLHPNSDPNPNPNPDPDPDRLYGCRRELVSPSPSPSPSPNPIPNPKPNLSRFSMRTLLQLHRHGGLLHSTS